jgi:cytochrome c-type biogenesis protein CcmH/NrfG
MKSEAATQSTATPTLQPLRVYAMATICLIAGLAIGYTVGGSPSAASPARQTATVASPSPHPNSAGSGRIITLEEMRNMADKQARPLLEKLKPDPNNSALLVQLGAVYHTAHQFTQAAVYYQRAVEADPGNVAARTKLASSLYRSGEVDGAIAQLNKALSYAPNDANSLFDLGMIRLQGKQDAQGALAAWRQLLKTNPQLSTERRATVQKLIAEVMNTLGDRPGLKARRGQDGSHAN